MVESPSEYMSGDVYPGFVPLGKTLNDRLRRQDGNRQAAFPVMLSSVPLGRPQEERIIPNQKSRAIDLNETTVGQ